MVLNVIVGAGGMAAAVGGAERARRIRQGVQLPSARRRQPHREKPRPAGIHARR